MKDVPWSTPVVLRDSVHSPALRMLSPSRRHEVATKLIARLLELFALERDIPLFGYRSTTLREELKERGLELLAPYAFRTDQHAALKELRVGIRQQ